MKTLEELKLEAQKTQEALERKLAEDRQAIRDAEAAAKREKAEAQLAITRMVNVPKAQALVDALIAVGYSDATFEWKESEKWAEYPVIKFTGESWATGIQFEAVFGGSTFHRHTTGFKVVIGGYGGKTLPQKKDGSFSYEKIAQAVKEIQASQSAKATQEQKEKVRYEANKLIRARICKAFGLHEYTSAVVPAKYADNKVTVKLELTLDETKAVELLNAVKRMGLDIH